MEIFSCIASVTENLVPHTSQHVVVNINFVKKTNQKHQHFLSHVEN